MLSLTDPLVWRGLLLSLAAVAIFLLLAWWLYWSPLPTPITRTATASPRLAGWLSVLLSLAGLQLIIGALWDASMHLQTGQIPAGADFLWPPHIMIYSSFLFSLLVGLVAIGFIARPAWRAGVRDPRYWVRSQPYVGAVAVASLYTLLALPGDAIWHEIVGIDLTAWSPPHLMIGLTSAAVMVSAVGLLVQTRRQVGQPVWAGSATMVLLALMLNMAYLVGVLEWELPVVGAHLSRPVWVYPLVAGSLAFFTLLLARRLVAHPWVATMTAGIYYLIRLSIMAGLRLTDNVAPAWPLVFILGAILLDLVAGRLSTGRLLNGRKAGSWLLAPAFTAGYVVLALPLLPMTTDAPGFGLREAFLATLWLLNVSLVLQPVVNALAGRLLPQT
jgi:hypothetical protein